MMGGDRRGRLLVAMAVGAVVAWGMAAGAQAAVSGAGSDVTSLGEYHALRAEELREGRAIRLHGVVLCFDRGWGQFYVHDGKQAAYFDPRPFSQELEVGQRIELTGLALGHDGAVTLTNVQVAVEGRASLPRPESLPISQFDRSWGQWVETEGVVRVAETSRERLALVLRDGTSDCLVYVMGSPVTKDFKRFVDARVRVRGINASRLTDGRLAAATLFSPALSEVVLLEPGPIDRWRLPAASIDALLNRELGDWTNQVVHLNGALVSYEPGVRAVIRDATGALAVEGIQVTPVQEGQRLDVWGFFCAGRPEAFLKDAYFEASRAVEAERSAATSAVAGKPAVDSGPTLTNVMDILRLPREPASWNRRVRLQGVVTYADPDWQVGFVQDHQRGIFMDLRQSGIHAGQWVEVTARTDRGGFAPQLVDVDLQVLGETNLPPASLVSLADLYDGHLDSHWVELQGMVRRVSKSDGRISLDLATREGRFSAMVLDSPGTPPPNHLLGAKITIRGACGSQMNSRGQLNGIFLRVPGLDQIGVLAEAPADPFNEVTTPVAEVARFNVDRMAGGRVKAHGQVTLVASGNDFVLQDPSGGIRVYAEHTEGLEVGQSVEVLGFPVLKDYSPALEEALYRPADPVVLPEPERVTAERILAGGTHDGMVIVAEARLLQSVTRSAQPKLVLQDGTIIFTARVTGATIDPSLFELQAGSRLRLTGVCSIQAGENREPESFRLQIARARDVVLLETPPWWSAQHTVALLAGLGIVTLLSASWVTLLRKQVKQRTRKLVDEIEERKRAEEALKKAQGELIATSRLAGMAEVATTVLHNVGNVLNSVNVSTTLVSEAIKTSRIGDVSKLANLMKEHAADLGAFVTQDPRGRRIPEFVDVLGRHLREEQGTLLRELGALRLHVDHIKDIVAMQQGYARVAGVSERVPLAELVDDALRMNREALAQHGIEVCREYEPGLPLITVEKHKALQILVNLLRNADHACLHAKVADKRLTVRIERQGETARISVSDNGIGIPPENLTRIFSYGFTTRKDGHGLGLHSGAVAAKEMGGSLRAFSEGPDKGATFVLELPLHSQGH